MKITNKQLINHLHFLLLQNCACKKVNLKKIKNGYKLSFFTRKDNWAVKNVYRFLLKEKTVEKYTVRFLGTTPPKPPEECQSTAKLKPFLLNYISALQI